MLISKLITRPPFSNLLEIKPEVLSAIIEDMEINGYDQSQPVVVWDNIVIDGHTRVKAATEVGIEDIPVFSHEFENDDDAKLYAIHNQSNRRNLSSGELYQLIVAGDELMARAEYQKKDESGKFGPAPPDGGAGGRSASAKQTAELVGSSPRTVDRVRAIERYGPPTLKNEVKEDKKSISRAYDEVQGQRKQEELDRLKALEPPKPPKPVFNKTIVQEECEECGHTIKDSIEWAYYTWNPATGCHHGCPYCYARDIANRFYTEYPESERFDYHFHPERLDAIKNMKIPKNDIVGEHNVFVCSMADLFGDWVPQENIDKVFSAIEEAPDWWNFLFLTKNPKRYLDLTFPEKSWLGATADTQVRADKTMKVFAELQKQENCPILFLSMEPLLERIILPENPPCDWLIIGGRSGNTNGPAMQPNWEWVESILQQFPIIDFDTKQRKNNMKIYFKPNCETRPREYPTLD